MSWQSYIDDHLLAAGFMYASINAHDGALWASSPGFVISKEECEKLSASLEGEISDMQANGFTIAGQKYTFTRAETADDDDNEGAPYVQGRCKEDGKSSQGAIVYKTSTALIVGVHDPAYSNGASFGKVNTDMGRVADYMVDSGN